MTRFFLFIFFVSQCSTAKPTLTSEVKVKEASYTKFITGARGDRGIIFRFVIEKPTGEVQFTQFIVNQQLLEPAISDAGENDLTFEAVKIYPGDQAIDPLPPGEPGNPLFFEAEFSAWLFWEKAGEKDSLLIEDWKEIKPEELPN